MPSSPPRQPASGLAVLLVLLLAACAPPVAQPRLPGEMGFRDGPRSRAQADQLTRMGRAALARGDAGAAAGLFEQAVLVDPDNPRAAIGFGEALLQMSRPQEAGEVFARAFTFGGAPAHAGYARAMVALNRPEAALEHLRRARELAPDDPLVLNALGVAYDMAGRHDEAAAAYRAGLELAPDDRALRNNLGLSLALAGKADESIAILRALAEGPGSDQRARQNLALAYGLKGDVTAAERLSRLDLGEGDVRNNLAIFAALRSLDSAEAASALAPTRIAPVPPRREPSPPRPKEEAPIDLAAVALGPGGLAVGASPIGSWFVDLGRSASPEAALARWQQLRRRHPQPLAGLTKLAGAGGGPEPLLVGPLPDRAAAQTTCERVRASAPDCAPIRL